jgi:adenosylmethionine-8-amino-7-oxononanoate aminotransferase
VETLGDKVALIAGRLQELADHAHVGDVRQCGMMVGIELVADRDARKPFDSNLRVGAAVCRHARKFGLITRPLGDVVVLMPAPAMDTETLKRMMDAAVETIYDYFENK